MLNTAEETKHTFPSGSTSRRCRMQPLCRPLRTYCPGVAGVSRTRKSPSCRSSSSHWTTSKQRYRSHKPISPNSTWLATSRLNTTRNVRRVEPVQLVVSSMSSSSCRACPASRARRVELVLSRLSSCACSTSSTQSKCTDSTRRTCCVETWRAKWNLGYTVLQPTFSTNNVPKRGRSPNHKYSYDYYQPSLHPNVYVLPPATPSSSPFTAPNSLSNPSPFLVSAKGAT